MRSLAALALLLALSTTAHAMLPPEAYEHARDDAAVLLTLAVDEVDVPGTTPGRCRVGGTIATLDRDATGRLAPGQRLAFDVACCEEGDEIPAGGTIWTDVGDLERTTLLRAWLVADGDGYRVALSQTDILALGRTPPSRFPWWGLGAGLAVVVASGLVMLRGRRGKAQA